MALNAGFIIILASVAFPITLVVTYTVSLRNRHILPVWPYISHTGNRPSESCFFSFGVNLVAGLYALITVFRYLQLLEYIKSDPKKSLIHLNRSSLAFGMIASASLSTTASFQQENAHNFHILSAVVCSYSALIYFWHQTAFSYIWFGLISKPMRTFRLILNVLNTAIHLFAPGLYLYSLIYKPMPTGRVVDWTDSEAITIYLAGSLLEWFMFSFNLLYIASLYREFTEIELTIGNIAVNRNRFL